MPTNLVRSRRLEGRRNLTDRSREQKGVWNPIGMASLEDSGVLLDVKIQHLLQPRSAPEPRKEMRHCPTKQSPKDDKSHLLDDVTSE